MDGKLGCSPGPRKATIPQKQTSVEKQVTQCIVVLQTPALSYPVRLGNYSQLPARSIQGLPRCSSRRHGRFGQSLLKSFFPRHSANLPSFLWSTQTNSGPTSNYQNKLSFVFAPLHILVPLPSGHMTGLWHVSSSSLGYQLSRATATFLAQLQSPTLRSQNQDDPAPWNLRSKEQQ